MLIRLYGLPASHPSAAVERALQLKRLDYQRRDRLPVLHRLQHRILFGQGSAPAARIGRRRVVGTMEIMGALDALCPDPPMFPSGNDAGRVIAAARWADAELQAVARRLAWVAMVARPGTVASVVEGSRLVLPKRLVARTSRPAILLGARLNGATEERARRDLDALAGLLDEADRLLADGILAEPNAATLQVAACVALLERLADVRELVAGRAIADVANAHFPVYPGWFPRGSLPVPGGSAEPAISVGRRARRRSPWRGVT